MSSVAAKQWSACACAPPYSMAVTAGWRDLQKYDLQKYDLQKYVLLNRMCPWKAHAMLDMSDLHSTSSCAYEDKTWIRNEQQSAFQAGFKCRFTDVKIRSVITLLEGRRTTSWTHCMEGMRTFWPHCHDCLLTQLYNSWSETPHHGCKIWSFQ